MVLFVQVRLAAILAAMTVSVAVDAVSVVGVAHEDTQAVNAPLEIPLDETVRRETHKLVSSYVSRGKQSWETYGQGVIWGRGVADRRQVEQRLSTARTSPICQVFALRQPTLSALGEWRDTHEATVVELSTLEQSLAPGQAVHRGEDVVKLRQETREVDEDVPNRSPAFFGPHASEADFIRHRLVAG